MRYSLSNYITYKEDGNNKIIRSQISNSTIELTEYKFIEELNGIINSGGTDRLESSLEQALFAENFLYEDHEEIGAVIEKKESETLEFILFPTEDCNLNCTYCYEKHEKIELKEPHYNLLLSLVKNAIDVDKKKVISVCWFGGEPLLKINDIVSFNRGIINEISNKDVTFVSGITTNGVLLNKTTFNLLLDNNITSYQITLDGYTHDEQRKFKNGAGSFNIILKNILDALTIKRDFKILLRVNITNKEFDFSFYDLFTEFSEDKRLQFLIRPVGKWGDEDFDLPIFTDQQKISEILKQHNDYIKSKGLFIYEEEKYDLLKYACYAGSKSTYAIRANGGIAKCTVAIEDDINNIGFLDLENGVMVIDEEKEKKWIEDAVTEKCLECSNLARCYNRVCPLKRINNCADMYCMKYYEVMA